MEERFGRGSRRSSRGAGAERKGGCRRSVAGKGGCCRDRLRGQHCRGTEGEWLRKPCLLTSEQGNEEFFWEFKSKGVRRGT